MLSIGHSRRASNNKIFTVEHSRSFYRVLKSFLSNECKFPIDTVVMDTPFCETSRDGKQMIRFVRLALTSENLVIASEEKQINQLGANKSLHDCFTQESISLQPWQSIKLIVFKKSKRQCIKVIFLDESARYFDLREMANVKIYWELWCYYICELNKSKQTWPFASSSRATSKTTDPSICEIDSNEVYSMKKTKKNPSWRRWTDKYLYLGSVREKENKDQPIPVPGLGKAEEIKLLSLKPRYFGCWEQSEHWVQCGESSPEFCVQNNKF